MRTLTRFVVVVVVAGVGLALGLLLLAPPVKAVFTAGKSAPEETITGELAQRSVVTARDGTLLAVLHREENRSPVDLEDVPQHVVDAVLDTEDDRFWDHGGVDLRSAARALFTNVSSGGIRQGGSTITQQLVKNLLLTPEQTVDRKVKEAVLAIRLEDELGKREILERYLNTVFFGNSAYGVQAAAETYYGKDVGDLTIGEAAFLAGLIRNPVGYDPLKFPEEAKERRSIVVGRMLEQGHLTAEQAAEIRGEPIPTEAKTPLPPSNNHFVESVKQSLLDDKRLGATAQERYNAVFKGGLRIVTTLDPKMEASAKEQVRTVVPKNKAGFTAAVATVEPSTGAVRAIVGGDFETEQYNLATQGKRQPGSSFKTFVLVAAIEEGYGPQTFVNGTSPCKIEIPGYAPWNPGNYEGSAGGVMSITDATARSVNCAYAKLAAVVGLEKVKDMAERMGIRSPLDVVPAMSLGSEEATPLEMASAYATLAADGVYHEPYFVEKVYDRNNKLVFRGGDKGKRVMTAQVARTAVQVLRAPIERGTGTKARLAGYQVFGKTGTSQNHENAWLVASTRQLSTAVWMGHPDGNVAMTNVGGIRVTGGSYPARIWHGYMVDAMDGLPALKFPAPDPKLIKNRRLEDPSKATPLTDEGEIVVEQPAGEPLPGQPGMPDDPAMRPPGYPSRPPNDWWNDDDDEEPPPPPRRDPRPPPTQPPNDGNDGDPDGWPSDWTWPDD